MLKRMTTYSLKGGDIEKDWHVIDADGQTLGRLASNVAGLLRGKHKPTYSPHLDMGDHMIIINAEKVKVPSQARVRRLFLTGRPLYCLWRLRQPRAHLGTPENSAV